MSSTTSRIFVDTASGHHILKIDNYSTFLVMITAW
jgi:hypothetical protein